MFPFTIVPARAKQKFQYPIVASIPHCGTYVPADIEVRFANAEQAALPMTDWYLQHLYDFLPSLGISVIYANYSRNVVDLNRSVEPLELYPKRFETQLVSDKTFQGARIFSSFPSETQIKHYTQNVHAPYHLALHRMFKDSKQKGNKRDAKIYLFDLHSIAPNKTLLHDNLTRDIYLGNRDGMSCDPEWFDAVDRAFRGNGFVTELNTPYKGGYITHHYGQDLQIQALQIEMNQSVYLEEYADVELVKPKNATNILSMIESPGFLHAKEKLSQVFSELVASL